jgi:hypothetical protein
MNEIGAVEHPGNGANRNVSLPGDVVDGDHRRILRDRERSNVINPSPEMRGPMPRENCRNAVRPHAKPLSLGEGLYFARSSLLSLLPPRLPFRGKVFQHQSF